MVSVIEGFHWILPIVSLPPKPNFHSPVLLFLGCSSHIEYHTHSYNSCCDKDGTQCYGQGNDQCLVVPHYLGLRTL